MSRRSFAAATAIAAVALIAAGCGGDNDEESSSADRAATLKVGVLPIVDVAPIYVGIEQGFFKRERLTVRPQIAQGGAEVVTGVVSRSFDIGFSATAPLAAAVARGIPVQMIASGVSASASAEQGFAQILVKKGSSIRSLKDLEGKTIAANALKGQLEVSVKLLLSRAGVDVSRVKLIEVDFPEMPATLQQGDVDAIAAVEPFVSAAKAEGARSVGEYFAGIKPRLMVAAYFASKQTIEERRDVVERFVRAMGQSLDYAQQHPEAVRKAVLTYTKIPPPAAEKMALPTWSPTIDLSGVQLISDATAQFGVVKEAPSTSQLVWSEARTS